MPYGTVNADVIQSSVTGASLGAGNSSIMKNRIINGAMVIDQRNAGASVTQTTSALYTVDRFYIQGSVTSKFTAQQSTTAPAGFVNSLKITSSSAYTVGTNEFFVVGQVIEGFNVADLNWGTANAKTVTLSFQVYSSLTGTFGGVLQNNAQNRSYPFSYTISSANTWTTISITVAGDTTGTWTTDNSAGIRVYFGLGVGSGLSGTAGSWAGSLYLSATGATSVVGTNGATFYITGVQLEVGSSATGFEYRQYGTELALCQRYYTNNFIAGTVPGNNTGSDNRVSICTVFNSTVAQCNPIFYPVRMRAAPSITFYSPSFINSAGLWGLFPPYWGSGLGAAISAGNVLDTFFVPVFNSVSGLTNSNSYINSGYWTASAEL